MNQLPVKAIVLLLVIVGFNILFGIDGVALLDPDEPVYAETAKEMIRFNEYLSPRIYNEYWYDKPPIFYWLLVGSLKLFGGFSELAARLPASLMAIGAVLMTTVSAARQFSARAGHGHHGYDHVYGQGFGDGHDAAVFYDRRAALLYA